MSDITILIDCLRYRPVACTATQMREAADELDRREAEILALREQVAALESREVCAVAHADVETCGYCQRDDLRRDAERYQWLRGDATQDQLYRLCDVDDCSAWNATIDEMMEYP